MDDGGVWIRWVIRFPKFIDHDKIIDVVSIMEIYDMDHERLGEKKRMRWGIYWGLLNSKPHILFHSVSFKKLLGIYSSWILGSCCDVVECSHLPTHLAKSHWGNWS